jgi:hypothetical protein
MMPTIRISDSTAEQLKKMARPLDDTWDSYLNRIGRFLAEREQEFLAFDVGPIRGHGSADVDAQPTAEQRYVAKMQPRVRALYEAVRQHIFSTGDDVEAGGVPSDSYVYFTTHGVRFATIRRKPNGLWLAVPPVVMNLEPNGRAELHNLEFQRPESRHWARTEITPVTDLNNVAAVLRDASDGVNGSTMHDELPSRGRI